MQIGKKMPNKLKDLIRRQDELTQKRKGAAFLSTIMDEIIAAGARLSRPTLTEDESNPFQSIADVFSRLAGPAELTTKRRRADITDEDDEFGAFLDFLNVLDAKDKKNDRDEANHDLVDKFLKDLEACGDPDALINEFMDRLEGKKTAGSKTDSKETKADKKTGIKKDTNTGNKAGSKTVIKLDGKETDKACDKAAGKVDKQLTKAGLDLLNTFFGPTAADAPSKKKRKNKAQDTTAESSAPQTPL